ncbi:MAG: hypothetical protein JKX68_03935 [Flavobacteriales bacterium]|nr:hypothetical protein [Flavobacteriales bacterium]
MSISLEVVSFSVLAAGLIEIASEKARFVLRFTVVLCVGLFFFSTIGS